MSGFSRRITEGHDNYLVNQQIALPISYSHADSHDFSSNGTAPHHFSQQTFGSYAPQIGPAYTQAGLPPGINLSSTHSIPVSPEDEVVQYQPARCARQARYLRSPRCLPLREAINEIGIESQESLNENTMLSEPVIPPLEGFPSVREFDQLIRCYVDDLSVKKQDKALIHARRARNIRTVLIDPKDTAIESAQFRFWVKKMFKLQIVGIESSNCAKIICHEGKPVAIREKLFKILTRAHQQCQHGGRDKTSAQVRQIYSWVPKELISRFVKICPTCRVRRGGARLTPPSSSRSSPRLEPPSRSHRLPSPPSSRRESILYGQPTLERAQADYLSQSNGQAGWSVNYHDAVGRSGLIAGSVRSLSGASVANLPSPMSMTLDAFHGGDLSQLSYGPAYATANEQTNH
ncbi:integrase zinc binding domain-containing protein [Aspergillus novofumigatus IBT 16806]|uniref:Integrase zinc-binding domain-containing protein n=1 Tax=Aspergillus novofumigatus (strain IBT 16806) TaxID=1392255 RepID=A0A2I1CGJ9_ASPN1|nr:uncharacterized protein P174DRAFT_438533 [Aspergillus novofumigatus IBT 16806]PKX96734.1 hypothetical protein P174DRAFT_438533 [Aspergillus novofumigatus IBT 16806]